MTIGPGIFFDGTSDVKRQLFVTLTAEKRRIFGPKVGLIATSPYDKVQQVTSPHGLLRLARTATDPARTEIRDATLTSEPAAAPAAGRPLLGAGIWTALQRLCSG